MRTEQRTSVKNSASRLIFVGLSVLFQIVWVCVLGTMLGRYSTVISLAASVIAFIVVMGIYGKHTNAAMKMPWIIVILTFPIMGVLLYLLMGRSQFTGHVRKRFEQIDSEFDDKLKQDEEVFSELEKQDISVANQCRYIYDWGKMPVYKNTDMEFYDEAVKGLKAQEQALKEAKHFIFMEYHAIEDARSFNELRTILVEKAKEGVEVRIFYDDVGSIFFLNKDFIKSMREEGIQCRVFNPVNVVFNMFMNNRDHRKITIIDGEVGFTGGYNLADEYFNYTSPYGVWKDTGVRLQGDAVKNLTVMFLEMWNFIEKTDTDYDKYLKNSVYKAKSNSFIQPYADSPLGEERIGENVYLNIAKNAKKYLYIMTPYLIITDEMGRELSLAAKRGVDVRLITPGIPDKKIVYQMTRSYYAGLVRNGVRIYEYTPGFCHAKQWASDGEVAIVGTINMDFRGLYLHFENGVFIYKDEIIKDIEDDFAKTMAECRDVTDKYYSDRSRPLRIGQCILRLFAPLV